jgi:hypothetical protein
MAIVTRTSTGGPSMRYPYVDTGDDKLPAGVGITTGNTIAVRVTPPGGGPVEVKVVSGETYVRVGAAEKAATGQECVVPAGDLLYLQGKATTAQGGDGAHAGCRIELGQGGRIVDAALQKTLGEARDEKVVNVVLVPAVPASPRAPPS